jgi:hypothetical protein
VWVKELHKRLRIIKGHGSLWFLPMCILFYWFVLLSEREISQFSSVFNIMVSLQIYGNIIFPLDLGIHKLCDHNFV